VTAEMLSVRGAISIAVLLVAGLAEVVGLSHTRGVWLPSSVFRALWGSLDVGGRGYLGACHTRRQHGGAKALPLRLRGGDGGGEGDAENKKKRRIRKKKPKDIFVTAAARPKVRNAFACQTPPHLG